MRQNSSDDMTNSGQEIDRRALAVLCAGHFTVDMCQGTLPLLLPLLLLRLKLDYTATAFIITTAYLTSSIAQPLFGFIKHRFLSQWAAPLGALVACAFLAIAAQSSSYPLLLALVIASSLGIALYHPEAAARANVAAGTINKGKGMSLFALSGSMGFSCAALFFGPLFAIKGTSAAWMLLVPGLAVALLLRAFLARNGVEKQSSSSLLPERVAKPMSLLIGTIAVRQWTMAGLLTFLPLYFTRTLHAPMATAGHMVFALQIGSDVGTLLCGWLAGKWGYKVSVVAALFTAAPLLLIFPHTSGFLAVGLLFLAGATLAIPVLGTTMIGQEIMPNNKALAASLTLGFGVGIGGIASGFLGRVADARGLLETLLWIGVAPLLGSVFASLLLNKRSEKRTDAVIPEQVPGIVTPVEEMG